MLTQSSAELTSEVSSQLHSTARPTNAATLRTPGTACKSRINAVVARFIAGSEVPGADCTSTTTSVSRKVGSMLRSIDIQIA